MRAVLASAVVASVLLGCDFSGPRSQITTAPDGLRTFTFITEFQGSPVACPAFGLVDPVHGTLEAQLGTLEPVWLRAEDGRQLSVVWPAGYLVRFEPSAALYNELGEVVAREGQRVELSQTRWDEGAGTFEDPYIAQGLVFGGCYSYFDPTPQ